MWGVGYCNRKLETLPCLGGEWNERVARLYSRSVNVLPRGKHIHTGGLLRKGYMLAQVTLDTSSQAWGKKRNLTSLVKEHFVPISQGG